jgi:hypothetical protein
VQDESRPKKKAKKDRETKDSGVSRGIDFLNVNCILNFDFPSDYKSYFHRIGRTARAGKSGTAISFIIPKDKYRKHKPTTFAGCENDEEVLKQVEKHLQEGQKLEGKCLRTICMTYTDLIPTIRLSVRHETFGTIPIQVRGRLEVGDQDRHSRSPYQGDPHGTSQVAEAVQIC